MKVIIIALLMWVGISLNFTTLKGEVYQQKEIEPIEKIIAEKDISSSYTQVSVKGDFNIVWVNTTIVNKIKVEGGKEALLKLETKNKKENLIIKDKRKKSERGENEKITLYIPIHNIDKLTIDGTGTLKSEATIKKKKLTLEVLGIGNIRLKNVEVDEFDLKVDGVANIEIEGSKNKLINLHNKGALELKMIGIETESTTVNCQGSAKIELAGVTNYYKLSVSGRAEIQSAELVSEYGNIFLSGIAFALIHVNETMRAYVSPSTKLYYKGTVPDIVNPDRAKQMERIKE